MTITVKKKEKVAEKTTDTQDTAPANLWSKVDEMGELKGKMIRAAKRLAPLTARYGELEVELLEYVDESTKKSEKKIVRGKVTQIEFSAKGNQTKVPDQHKVYKMLEKVEKGLGDSLMSFGIGDMNKYLTPKQMAKVSTTDQVSKRRLKITDR